MATTITPNPSEVGDLVAVATVADVVNSDYNFNDLTPFFPLSPYEGMVINVTSPTDLNYNDDGSFCFSYSQSIVFNNEPIKIDFVRNNTTVGSAGFSIRATNADALEYVVLDIISLSGTNTMRVYDTNGFNDFSAPVGNTISCHYENDGNGNSIILIKDGVTVLYTATGINDLSDAESLRLGLSHTGDLTYISGFNINLTFYPSYSLTQDGVEITSGTTTGGAISYDHTAALADNGTAWEYIVDGVGTGAETMLVNEPPSPGGLDLAHAFSFGGVAIGLTVEHPIRYTLELGAVSSLLTNGEVSFRDLGASYDKFRTKFERVVTNLEQAQLLQEALKSPVEAYIDTPEHIHPFGPLFSYPAPVRMILDRASFRAYEDDRAAVNPFSFEFIPATSDIYGDFTKLSGSLTDCYSSRTTWTLGGVALPYPVDKFNPIGNEPQNGLALPGNFSQLDRPLRSYLEESTFRVELDLEAARLLLSMLVSSRFSGMTMTAPENSLPFGPLYDGVTSYTVGLSSNKIEMEYIKGPRFIFTLRVQIRGV